MVPVFPDPNFRPGKLGSHLCMQMDMLSHNRAAREALQNVVGNLILYVLLILYMYITELE